jgi:hypothetical protein
MLGGSKRSNKLRDAIADSNVHLLRAQSAPSSSPAKGLDEDSIFTHAQRPLSASCQLKERLAQAQEFDTQISQDLPPLKPFVHASAVRDGCMPRTRRDIASSKEQQEQEEEHAGIVAEMNSAIQNLGKWQQEHAISAIQARAKTAWTADEITACMGNANEHDEDDDIETILLQDELKRLQEQSAKPRECHVSSGVVSHSPRLGEFEMERLKRSESHADSALERLREETLRLREEDREREPKDGSAAQPDEGSMDQHITEMEECYEMEQELDVFRCVCVLSYIRHSGHNAAPVQQRSPGYARQVRRHRHLER